MLREKRASVLLVVLITITFAAFMLTAFIERASTDLLVEERAATANHLRADAYSSLEVTLAVLSEFIQTDGALHSPAEGWGDPLAFAGYEPASGRPVEVTFKDESGKLSLPHTDVTQLTNLFQSWGVTQSDAEQLADALLTWMRADHVASTDAGTPDYDRAAIPYAAPQRSLRSFDELAAIDFVNKKFYDENGRPNDLWQHFATAFSLYDFPQSNLNAAGSDTFAAYGQSASGLPQNLSDYLQGTGDYQQQGPGYFKNTSDANHLLGGQTLPQGIDTKIAALRVIVTVHEANASFQLNVVVAPPNGAKPVASTEQVANANSAAANQPAPGAAATASASTTAAVQLNYPFTLLEVHEEIIDNAGKPPPPSDTIPST
ncbi:MAG TPA: hypothetical protein VNW23_02160 [Opitutaceae bacterium]|jgi:hypothetical protein|nr:hypothetical protein [Opitutaceae bacterium]